MGFEALSNIVLLLAIFGIIVIVLRHLPDAVRLTRENAENEVKGTLSQKGVEAKEPSKLRTFIHSWRKRMWFYLLEAKGVRPGNKVGYRLKKMLKRKGPIVEQKPIIPPPVVVKQPEEAKNEKYYLDKIKHEPKNLEHYKGLGTFYLDSRSFEEARDVFSYLASHLPADATVHGKLAYANFHLKDYAQAIESYEKSVRLDSTQPNRYYNLSLAYEASGNFEKAMKTLKKAVEIEPTNSKYIETLRRMQIRPK